MAKAAAKIGILGPVDDLEPRSALDYQRQQFGDFNKEYFIGAAPAVAGGTAVGYAAAKAAPQVIARTVGRAALNGALGQLGALTYPASFLIDHARHFDNALQNRLATKAYARHFGTDNPYEDNLGPGRR